MTIHENHPSEDGIGCVETRFMELPLPPEGLVLEGGGRLPAVTVAYETYGELSPERDNAIFICHALTGDAHVAGRHTAGQGAQTTGWWDQMVGPGKGINTNYYFVICANILGGCSGTTGPASINPATGEPYGADFPEITVGDIVDVHQRLVDGLGIPKLAAVIGGSFGGMQALEWTVRHPDRVSRCACIASATSLSTQALAFDIVGRSAITADPNWQNGRYHLTPDGPREGLALARKIGHITYLSNEMMAKKFGRVRKPEHIDPGQIFQSGFEVERYLNHQGHKFVDRFDANSYLYITHAMDNYDLAERYGSLETAFRRIQGRVLVVALSKDWLFPPEQSEAMAHALLHAGCRTSYCRLHAPHGHDAFLVDVQHLAETIRAFLPWIGLHSSGNLETTRREHWAERDELPPMVAQEHRRIAEMIPRQARVLDLGCGNGVLLSQLVAHRQASGLGVDIDLLNVIEVIDRGHDILQVDIDAGLAAIPDAAYDVAVLSQTLQVVRKPRLVLQEMLRVAHEGLITFPNFGNWFHRAYLAGRGRMPKGGTLPFDWYDTPNIHLFTLRDFLELCRAENICVSGLTCIAGGTLNRLLIRAGLCNLGAERVLARITRNSNTPTADCRAEA